MVQGQAEARWSERVLSGEPGWLVGRGPHWAGRIWVQEGRARGYVLESGRMEAFQALLFTEQLSAQQVDVLWAKGELSLSEPEVLEELQISAQDIEAARVRLLLSHWMELGQLDWQASPSPPDFPAPMEVDLKGWVSPHQVAALKWEKSEAEVELSEAVTAESPVPSAPTVSLPPEPQAAAPAAGALHKAEALQRALRQLAAPRSRRPEGNSPEAAQVASVDAMSLFLDTMKMGEALMKRREFPQAEVRFAEAYNLQPSAEALAARAWAIYMDPSRRAEAATAKSWMGQALQMDAQCVRAQFQMGVVSRIEGNLEAAESHFRRVLEAQPKHLEAAQELRLLEVRKKRGSSSA